MNSILTVTIRDGETYYKARLTRRQVSLWDNGAMVSCGLTVGEGRFKAASLRTLQAQGRVQPIDRETYLHSGCQSSCVRRGGSICRW